ncbi:hypothetical protein EVAR_14617_1 [Eumeta japonica]|uniref:Uncharacterized protein n=1 Tax=Eumeta variegata TaxID=151549 RepID=A0A4C1UUI4_EUMVA|nr:hypothetical protein EVAR_14617_1 [Eumeta japonica]
MKKEPAPRARFRSREKHNRAGGGFFLLFFFLSHFTHPPRDDPVRPRAAAPAMSLRGLKTGVRRLVGVVRQRETAGVGAGARERDGRRSGGRARVGGVKVCMSNERPPTRNALFR